MNLGVSLDVANLPEIPIMINEYKHILKHVQIYLDDSPFVELHQQLRTILLDERISYSIHAPGSLNVANISHYEDAIKIINMASSINGIFVNLHVGFYESNKESHDKMFIQAIKQIEKICEYAENKGVEIHIENGFETHDGISHLGVTMSEWEILHNISQKNLYMCYDIGHACIAFDDAFQYRKFISRIGSFHIHNNDGIQDFHLPFGTEGAICLTEVMRDLYETNKYLILENYFVDYKIALDKVSTWHEKLIT